MKKMMFQIRIMAIFILMAFTIGVIDVEAARRFGHQFPRGQCTWYVAKKVYIPFGGHAKTWYDKAKSRGYKTYKRGKKPVKGCIVVFKECRSYPTYGHVAYVEKRKGSKLYISEMNVKGWNVKSYRWIKMKDRNIKGFIFSKKAIKKKYKKKNKKKYKKWKKRYKKSKIWYDPR